MTLYLASALTKSRITLTVFAESHDNDTTCLPSAWSLSNVSFVRVMWNYLNKYTFQGVHLFSRVLVPKL